MRGSHLLVAILLTGSVVMGTTVSTPERTTPVAREKAEEQTATEKWEYCTVTKAAYTVSNRAGLYWITYFRSSGFQVVNVEDNATSNAALSKAIAQLGDEGWEMVGVGPLEVRPGSKLDAYYFKRPKQRP